MKKGCDKECIEGSVCDFCLHFLFFRDKDGYNIDGSGYCGLHRKEVNACDDCNNFYCKTLWEKDMEKLYKDKL